MLALFCTILLYFLPAIIGRDKRDATGIFLLNLFLGWTVVGVGDCADLGVLRAALYAGTMGARKCKRKVLLPVRVDRLCWGAFLHRVRACRLRT